MLNFSRNILKLNVKFILLSIIFLMFSTLLISQDYKYSRCERFSNIKKATKHKNRAKIFNLSDGNLKEIPRQVYELDSLEVLTIGSNNFNYIHIDIENLNNLKVLYIFDNPINSLPLNIALLPKLERLVIIETQIEVNDLIELKLLNPKCIIIANN